MGYVPSLFSISRNIQISLKIAKNVYINFAILYNYGSCNRSTTRL